MKIILFLLLFLTAETQAYNFPAVYQLFGPVGSQQAIVGPHNTRDWMVPMYLTSSNSKTFLFNWQGGSRRKAHWARFVVIFSSASPNNCFRLIYWIATPYDPTSREMGRVCAGDQPYTDSVGVWKAHPMAVDVTAQFNKLITDKKDVYILWQVKDDGTEWRAWEARLEVFWED